MPTRTDDRVRCSFCGKTQDQVRKLIAGSKNVFICDECIELCGEILAEELEEEEEKEPVSPLAGINLLKPKEIKAFLDEYVIGQDAAKKVLSVAFTTTTNVSPPVQAVMWTCRRAIFLCWDRLVPVRLIWRRLWPKS